MKKCKDARVISENSTFQKSRKKFFGVSLIIYLLDKLSDAIYNALSNGIFGYIFTAYSSESLAYENGSIKYFLKSDSKTRQFFRRIRAFLSKSFETSFILGKLRSKVCGMANVPVKSYGRFFISFGVYTLLVYFIKALVPRVGNANSDYLFVGIAICLIAAPLQLSRLTLAQAVKKGRITKAIFVDAFGYRDESFNSSRNRIVYHAGVAIMSGLVAGVLTFVIHPLTILALLAGFVAVALIMVTPEIGVLACLFFLPFFSLFSSPTIVLCVFVLVTAFSYFIKLVRGKRILKLEILDIFVFAFMILVFCSGAISVGGKESFHSAIITCILLLSYFIIVNLIRTVKWLHRCLIAIVSSGTVVAVLGVLQYISGNAINDWIDTSYFTNIDGRVTSLFENPNYLATYLSLILPLALYQTLSSRHRSSIVLGWISCAMIVLCTVFTWCRAAWLAMIFTVIIFLMIYSRKTLRYLLLTSISIPFMPFVLPKNVIARFMSIGDMSDSSTLYRVYTWQGCLTMIKDYFWGGIGYGTEAFAQLYPLYAYAGISSAVHSHSLYLQIMISMGICGLICFSILIFFYFQNCLEYIKKPSASSSSLFVAACLSAVVAALIIGLFDYIWYNYRVFFTFWAVFALGIACLRVGYKEISKNVIKKEDNDYQASLEVEI